MATDDSASSRAAHKALQAPKLLEAILFELPTKDLLFAQKVCKFWQASIGASIKLQRALFCKKLGRWAVPDQLFRPRQLDFIHLDRGQKIIATSGTSPQIRLPESWFVEAASWRKMLPSHPPIPALLMLSVNFTQRDLEDALSQGDTSGKAKAWLDNYTWSEATRKWSFPDGHPIDAVAYDEERLSDAIECIHDLVDTVPDTFRGYWVMSIITKPHMRTYLLKNNADLEEVRQDMLKYQERAEA